VSDTVSMDGVRRRSADDLSELGRSYSILRNEDCG
jgi:hypothetical protein